MKRRKVRQPGLRFGTGLGARRESDLEAQNRILGELRALIGGPRSLRFQPRLLGEGLCGLVGRLAAYTLRDVPDVLQMLRAEYDRATPVQLEQSAEVCDARNGEEVTSFLILGLASPGYGKRPSHLVLGAALSVLAQLARAGAIPLEDCGILIQSAHHAVPKSDVDAFQRAAAAVRAN